MTHSIFPHIPSFLTPFFLPMFSLNPSKRKLSDTSDDPSSSKMRKDNPQPKTSSEPKPHFQENHVPSTPRVQTRLVQFFVKVFSGKTLVLVCEENEVVNKVHERVFAVTGIPVNDQRLLYNGKQLQGHQTLVECGVSDEANLQLVGRMRSTDQPLAWQLLNDMVDLILHNCRYGPNSRRSGLVGSYVLILESNGSVINDLITKFLCLARKHSEKTIGHLKVFQESSVPLALVLLYKSVFSANRGIAGEAIKHFITCSRITLDKDKYRHCAPIVLEFCKLLRRGVGTSDPVYIFCRDNLGYMIGDGSDGSCVIDDLMDVQEYLSFITELAWKLSHGLVLSMGSEPFSGVSPDDVRDFTLFLDPVRKHILLPPLSKGENSECDSAPRSGELIEFLHGVFKLLVDKIDSCLAKLDTLLALIGKENLEPISSRWDQYLAILKVLDNIAMICEGDKELFWGMLGQRKSSFCYLIVKFAKRTDDQQWILVHKKVTNFEARKHLVMMMFPDVKDDYDELHEMLIDRSHLLAESFAYIGRAKPKSLHGGIFMEFKNEEATGPGVLREWFVLVCQAIFDPKNGLFAACPNDPRKFFPNPASKVDPLHLKYFRFSGRVIALALMHNIQVGKVFDRVFFAQLAGKKICLKDICDADPNLYKSCKDIIEMEADLVDQDDLVLTFIREINEFGTTKVVELCPNGENISVTSKNRKEYVYRLVQHIFVTSIAEQVSHFTEGFADIMNSADAKTRVVLQKSFFKSIQLEDFGMMLHGSERPICVENWMAHTKYNGFKETDPQICWFWKIVGEMSAQQKRVLLFFWTSVKVLPVEGFRGLASLLYIDQAFDPSDHLPTSHTCFYRLCFPAYPSEKIMRDRLHLITQEHVGCSFGTW